MKKALQAYGFRFDGSGSQAAVTPVKAVKLFEEQEGTGHSSGKGIDPATVSALMQRATWLSAKEPVDYEAARDNIVKTAQALVGVREKEGQPNRGPEVEGFLRSDLDRYLPPSAAAPAGSYWCASFVSHVMNKGAPELTKSAGGAVPYTTVVSEMVANYRKAGALVKRGSEDFKQYEFKPGDLVFWGTFKGKDWQGHVGIVERVDHETGKIYTIDGNAAPPGQKDGIGVLRKELDLNDVRSSVYGVGSLQAMTESINRTRSKGEDVQLETAALPSRRPSSSRGF